MEVNESNDSRFIKDLSIDKTIEDVTSYYGGIKVMTEEKFNEQQCGKLGDTIFYTQNNNNPMSLTLNDVSIKEILDQSELEIVEESVKYYTGLANNWNCFLHYNNNQVKTVTRDEIEAVSKYVFIDLKLENLNQTELFLYLMDFKLIVTQQNKTWDNHFYANPNGLLIPSGIMPVNSVLISSDKTIQYVTVQNQSNGTIKYYRELNRENATIKDAFYVDDTLNLRLMFVCTDEEIATGRLSLCSNVGNASLNGQFTNQGFVIELGEEIKNAADNQSGDE